jgi:hypothetical protein
LKASNQETYLSVSNTLTNVGSGSYITIPTTVSETKNKSDQSKIKSLAFDPKSILKIAPTILSNVVTIGTTIASIMSEPEPAPKSPPATFKLAESNLATKLAGYRI